LGGIDSNGLREKLPFFCAANMARIPTLPDEMSDLTNMGYELSELRKQVKLLSSYLRPPPVWKSSNELSNEQSRKLTVHPHPQSNVEATGENFLDDAAWEKLKKKVRSKYKKMVIGHSEKHTSFEGIAKKSVVCVSRLKSGTPTDVVSDHLKNNGISVLSCFDVSPVVEDELKYTSMRVCVYSMDIKKLYDGNLWPMGVVVLPWKFTI